MTLEQTVPSRGTGLRRISGTVLARSGMAARWLVHDQGAVLRRYPEASIGFAAIVTVVVLSVVAGVDPRLEPPGWPLTSLDPASDSNRGWLAVGVVLAVGALVAVWACLARRVRDDGMRLRAGVPVAALWATPFMLGPPLLSMDVYSYAAVGRLAHLRWDPYLVGPAALGGGPFLAGVDPMWKQTPSPYGPVLVALMRGAVSMSGDSQLIAVLLLRVIAVGAAAVATALAVWAAAPWIRSQVLLLTALNPLVLLHLVSGAHLDAVVGALAVLVALLTVRGQWYAAMALAMVAFMAKAPGLVLVGFVLLAAVRHIPAAQRARTVTGLLTTAGAVGLGLYLIVPDAFGWINALGVPGRARNLAAPSAWVSHLVAAMGSWLPVHHLAWSTAVSLGRAVVLLAGGVVTAVLLWRATTRRHPGEALRLLGWALIVVALSGPVVYGWYLAWGLFAAVAGSRPRERAALLVLSALTSVIGLPSMLDVPIVVQVLVWGTVLWLWWRARPDGLWSGGGSGLRARVPASAADGATGAGPLRLPPGTDRAGSDPTA